MTTQTEAMAALEEMHATMDVDALLGVPPPGSSGPFWTRGIGVSASPPDYHDHLIVIKVPSTTDVSRIPRDFKGVRIVVELLDQPGAVAYGPDPHSGLRL